MCKYDGMCGKIMRNYDVLWKDLKNELYIYEKFVNDYEKSERL